MEILGTDDEVSWEKVWQMRLGDFYSCPSDPGWIDADILLLLVLIY